MHIPDGYLSPATCAATYALVLPFWTIALRRVGGVLGIRSVHAAPIRRIFTLRQGSLRHKSAVGSAVGRFQARIE